MTEMALPTDPEPRLHLSKRGGSAVNIVKMTPEMKRCSKCQTEKSLDQFAFNRTEKDGRQTWCRVCMSDYSKKLYRSDTPAGARYRENTWERGRIHHELRKDPEHSYAWASREKTWRRRGIKNVNGTQFLRADYHRLLELQGGVCALCGRHPPMWSRVLNVDHNAKTGLVRGLLCSECNQRAVGTFEKWGRFTNRKDVNDLIQAYLANPPSSRLPKAEETDGLEAAPPVQVAVTNPQEYHISWTPLFSHEVTP